MSFPSRLRLFEAMATMPRFLIRPAKPTALLSAPPPPLLNVQPRRAYPLRSIAEFVEAQKVASLLAELVRDGHRDAAPLLREAVRWVRRANPSSTSSAATEYLESVCSDLLELAGAA